MRNSQKITPSIKKTIIALNQYLNELNQEKIKYEEEYSYLQKAMAIIMRKKEKQKPIIDKMMGPIQALQERSDQNANEIDEYKMKNDVLNQKIAEIEQRLSSGFVSAEQLQRETNYIESNLSDYKQIFSELFQPCPLPYPYTIDSYMNWAIVNRDKIILPKYQHDLCEKLHNCPSDFDSLSFTEKEYVISLLKKCQVFTKDLVKEVRKADLYLASEPSKHDYVVRKALKKYAVIALSMQKVVF